MKYTYLYKTADNVQRQGSVRASSRDRAFDKVIALGHKPYKLELASGVSNRIMLHLMKWGALESAALAVVVVALVFAGLVPVKTPPAAPAGGEANEAIPVPRMQIADIPGDFAKRLPGIFPTSAERFLALHARPGVLCEVGAESLSDLAVAIERDTRAMPLDPEWEKSLKRIVAGMKEEAASLLKSGKSVDEIALWLAERQKMEASYRAQILESSMPDTQKSKTLRAMGL